MFKIFSSRIIMNSPVCEVFLSAAQHFPECCCFVLAIRFWVCLTRKVVFFLITRYELVVRHHLLCRGMTIPLYRSEEEHARERRKIPVGLGDTSVMRLKRIIIFPKTFDLSLNMYE